jgi:biofilm PGA synthesis lipoprotein PgaB
MSWAQIRELAQAGVTFANHSGSHDHLVRRLPGEDTAQWRARVRADIGQAQTRLQQELGSAQMLFAWPYGEYDTGLLALVQELGYTAFGQQSGPAGRNADPRALPRYPVAVAFAGLDELRDKLSARPLPVQQATPSDPVLPVGEARPLLTIQLQPGGYRPGTLACYVSGQGRVAVQWQDAAQTRFAVQAAQALPVGRSRYNCTAQATDGQGWLWFSQPWIRRNPDGSWYRE